MTGMFAPARVVAPVPPLAIASVPATLTAPLVAVLGVSPVEPKLMVETLVAGAVDCHVVPLLVSTLPFVPGATTWNAEVPLPSRTLFVVNVAAPVPPLATGRVPVTSEAKFTLLAVNADVPLPLRTPVSVVAPVPPEATGNAAPSVKDPK